MKIVAVNGSPRKDWNTATLLKKALEGANEQGAETKLVHLYEHSYHGCVSCFSCKRKGGIHGVCAMKDELTSVLLMLHDSDAIIWGSPIYFMNLSSGMAACLERFLFPGTIYSKDIITVFEKKIATGFIYTMNMTKDQATAYGLEKKLDMYHQSAKLLLGVKPQVLYAYDTYQFLNYADYESSIFSEESKRRQRKEQFPKDCEKAFRMGALLTKL